ncbi:MAG: sulfatase family protein [Acidimicrobiia bacterium]
MTSLLHPGRRALVVGLTVVAAVSVLAASTVGPAGAAGTPVGRPPAAVPARPNILFVLTDDMTVADLGSMPGVRRVITDHGLRFTRAMVSVSLCCPSRTTILRGQYAHNTGVLTNGGTNGGFEAAYRFGVERSTIATWLRARGSRTALIGKYLNGFPNTAPLRYRPPGWTDWVTPVSGDPYNQFDYVLDVNGRLEEHDTAPRDYGTTVYLRHARSFVDAAHRAHQPFFLDLALYAPHRPATPAPPDLHTLDRLRLPRPPSFNVRSGPGEPRWLRAIPPMRPRVIAKSQELFQRRRESLRSVDRAVVHLVGELRRLHELDRTYVVFMSDNGFHQGQHRLPAGKETAFDEDIRVPLVVRGPGVPTGHTGALVGNVDVAPTFARLAGARVPRFVDGRSFVDALRGHGATFPRHAFLIEHWDEVGQTPRGPSLPLEPPDRDQTDTPLRPHRAGGPRRKHQGLIENDRIPEFRGVRTDTYTYVEYVDGERELYDVRRDPYELHNIIGEVTRPTRVALVAELGSLTECSAHLCRDADARHAVTLRLVRSARRHSRPARPGA